MLNHKISYKKLISLLILFWIVLTGFVLKAEAATGINEQVNFQGKVVKTDGTNVTNGNYDFVFKIYKGGDGVPGGGDETLQWTETRTAANQVAVTDGVFQVNLGSVNAFGTSVDWNSDTLWLSVNFNGDGEMANYIRLTAVPYAFNAKKVNGLDVTTSTGTPFSTATALKLKDGSTVSFGGDFSTTANNSLSLTTSGATSLTLPTSGTLATLAGSESFTNKTLSTGTKVLLGSDATGDMYYNGGSGTLTRLAVGTSSQVLLGGTTPSWGSVPGSAITANDLDFAQFKDAMTLDASTDISITGSNVFSLTNTGSGNSFVVNDQSTDTSPFVIDASGNVGIGTTAPTSAKLQVQGNIAGYNFYPGNGGIQTSRYFGDDGTNLTINGAAKFTSGADFNAQTIFNIGSLGIGTTSITGGYAFDSRGAGTFTSTSTTAGNKALNVSQSGATAGTDYGIYVSNTGAGAPVTNVGAYFTASGGGNNYAAIFDQGNVGVGTTAPTYALDVSSSGSPFHVKAGTTDAITVDSSGHVGIGTTTTGSFTLNVQGSNLIYLDTTGGIRLGDVTNNGNSSTLTLDDTNQYAYFLNNNVGIGTSTPSANKLQVASGNIGVDSTYGLDTNAGTGTLALGATNATNVNIGNATSATNVTLKVGTTGNFKLNRNGSAVDCSGNTNGGKLTTDSSGNIICGNDTSGGSVSSVSDDGNGTLTISPTTGAVLAGLNLAHANTWTATQTITKTVTSTGSLFALNPTENLSATGSVNGMTLTPTLGGTAAANTYTYNGVNFAAVAGSCPAGATCNNYGMNFTGTGYTAEMKLQNGATIDNATSGTILFTATTTKSSGNFTVGTSGTGTVTAGTGNFSAALNAGSSSQFGVDASGNVTTTGYVATGTTPATAGQVRLPNASWIAARNAANNANINMIEIDGSNLVAFGANLAAFTLGGTVTGNSQTVSGLGAVSASSLALGTNPAAAGTLRLPNATYITARNAANSADINMIRVDASNLVAFGANTAAFTLGGAITGNSQNITGLGTLGAGTGNFTTALNAGSSSQFAVDASGNLTTSGTITQTYAGSSTATTLTANSVSGNNVLSLSGTSLTTGNALSITGPSSGSTKTTALASLTSNVGNTGTTTGMLSLNTTAASAGGTSVGFYNSLTDAIASANTDYGGYFSISNTGALNAASTKTIYGNYIAATGTGATTNASVGTNVYGEYITTTASHATNNGTVNQYGLYLANGTSSTNGTSNKYGLYVESPTGADNNYAAIFAGGNVGIGITNPTANFVVQGSTSTNIADFTDGTTHFGIYPGSTPRVWIGTTTADRLDIGTGGNTNQAISIDSSNRVGVNTNSPSALFSVGSAATSPFQVDNSGNTTLGTGANLTMTSGTGIFSQTFSSNTNSAKAQDFTFTNSATAGSITVVGTRYTLANGNNGSNTNKMYGIDFTAATNFGTNTINGINFESATGFTNFIKTPTFTLTSAGAITGSTGISMTSGDFDQSASSGNFSTGTGTVSLNGATTVASGKTFRIVGGAGSPTATSGIIWYDTTANKFKIVENGTVKIVCNTTDAGCGAGGSGARLDQITAATTTSTIDNTTNAIAWNWDSLTTQTALTIGSGSTTATTGTVLKIGNGISYAHTASETGNVADITFTDTSATGLTTTVTNGLYIQPTMNATSGVAARTLNGISLAPKFTACSAGSCAVNALSVTGATAGSGFTETGVNISGITAGAGTETALSIGSGWDTGFNITSGNNIIDTAGGSDNGLLLDIASSSSSQYALKATSNNGSTTGLYVGGDGRVVIGGTSSVGSNPLTVLAQIGTGFAVQASGAGNSPQFSLYDDTGNQKSAFGLALAGNHYSGLSQAGDSVLRSVGGRLIILGDAATIFTNNPAGSDTETMRLTTSNQVGIGTGSTVSAKVHVLSTTEQLRLGYDASNYQSFTINSNGDLTLSGGVQSAATGTGTGITLQGGSESGGTAGTGGALTLAGGNAIGASGTRTGGNVLINAGTGATANGSVKIGGSTAGGIEIGNIATAKTITIGTTGNAADTINIGTGTNTTGTTINIGNGVLNTKVVFLARSNTPTTDFSTNGQFAFGVAASTAATGGRIWIRSNSLNFRFNSATNTADYSEYLKQDDTSEPGDVMVMSNTNSQSVKKSTQTYDQKVMGVVTRYGTSYNDDDCGDANGNNCAHRADPHYANVGMLGQVYTKISTENGTIQQGDPLTSSSLAGVAMKATKQGRIIGYALDTFDGSHSGHDLMNLPDYPVHQDIIYPPNGPPRTVSVGKILIFLQASWYDPNAPPPDIGDTTLVDQGGGRYGLVNSLTGEPIATQVLGQDGIIANLQTGHLSTKELNAEDIFAKGITVKNSNGDVKVQIDENGNASFNGTITADRIVAGQIDGLDVIGDQVALLDNRVASLEATLAGMGNQTNGQFVSEAGGVYDDLLVNKSATISGNLHVAGATLIEGVLNVIDSLTAKNLLVGHWADFMGSVIFRGDTNFEGRPTFNSDTAGFAVVYEGQDTINVTFDKEYEQMPVITANLNIHENSDQTIEQASESAVLNEGFNYVITRRSTRGFTIKLNKPATQDLTFSWVALAVKDAKTVQGTPNSTPAPTQTPVPTSGPSPTDSPSPSSTPTPTPTSAPEPTSTPSVTETPTPTP
jgi:hypothetical protein